MVTVVRTLFVMRAVALHAERGLWVDCEMRLTTPSHWYSTDIHSLYMAARVEEVVTALRIKAADDSKISVVKAQVIAPPHSPCCGQSQFV